MARVLTVLAVIGLIPLFVGMAFCFLLAGCAYTASWVAGLGVQKLTRWRPRWRT